jgi:HAD superfamily hydrolase (TIGR01490 family)
MIAAIFDIEGTLYTNPMGRGFMQFASAHGRAWRTRLYFASLMPRYFLSKLNLVSRESLNATAIARMPWLIQGYDRRQADAAFDWVANEFILPSGRSSVLDCWEEHRRSGHLMMIASGGLAPCVQRIGSHLRAAGTAGTEIEMQAGRCTTRIGSPVVIGPEKAARTLQLVSQLGAQVDWPASYAYADSIHDLPFLELAGHPVAVHPDAKLRRIAAEREWPVLEGE